ncbi:MAG TPA: type II secretion system minor pseudopilin GspH [Steroidobacteraceae bacterium]|nr:type II secretion system minor pseudopilin GspH [Steroidobacteraceae bacterium]
MRQRGFTLIEILVAVLIIGIMIVGVTLATGVAVGDRQLDTERDRIMALADHLRDQAALQAREYGLRCFEGGYQFLAFDSRQGLWLYEGDDLLRERTLPEGITLRLWIEGRAVVLPEAEVEADELAPQIMLYSSGDLNLFELELRREGGGGVRIAPAVGSDRIEATVLEAERR